MSPTRYFPHIDGLRAFAVIAVVLFHYKVPGFSGGYSGVDIFFVISGFLITGIIQNKYEAKKFSLLGFYKKRFYRIYPALLFVSILTFIAAIILFSPKHLENLSQSMLGALTFTSNIIYWKNIGYFQILDGYDPFVPTWSLSIELQYYLLFPPFYLLLLKLFKHNVSWVMLLGTIGSIALAEIFLRFTNNFVYYNLPFRFFEFGIGALCYYALKSPRMKDINTSAFPILGTILIACGFFLLDEQTPFPGFWALLPCVGAALIILAKDKCFTSKLFDNPVSIYIGHISYSLYLIHWPLYVLYAYWYYSEVSLVMKLSLFVIAISLAAFTHHYVENSYRHKKLGLKRRILLFSSSLLILLCGYSAMTQGGWSWRLTHIQEELFHNIDKENTAFQAEFDKKFPLSGETEFVPEKHSGLECSYNNTKDLDILVSCLTYNLTRKSGVGSLIIGDSNGANTYRALELAYPDHSFAMLQQGGCAATTYLEDNRSGLWCFKDLHAIVERLHQKGIVNGVILSSRWVLQPYNHITQDIENYKLPVMLVGPTPMLRHDTFETFFMLGAHSFQSVKTLPFQEPYFYADTQRAEAFLEDLPVNTYISKSGLLCPSNSCPLFIGKDLKPLFLDDQHFSAVGIKYLSNLLQKDSKVQKFVGMPSL
ncbi:MAG: hypothetical protein COA45_04210 [Zetaproteobacteria bacterium]|nr:MAG: hypothetical protein COA45_04210 [Zetaproteobacteria bacterium]